MNPHDGGAAATDHENALMSRKPAAHLETPKSLRCVMSASKIVEFSFCFLLAFLIVVVVSCLSARPILNQVKDEAAENWISLRKTVEERNELLPGLLESLRGFQPVQGQLVEKLMESRAISMCTTDSDAFVAALDDMDGYLSTIAKYAESDPKLEKHPPFSAPWTRVRILCQRVRFLRGDYNRSAGLYNRLVAAFPQNLMAALFGFQPMKQYQDSVFSDDPWRQDAATSAMPAKEGKKRRPGRL